MDGAHLNFIEPLDFLREQCPHLDPSYITPGQGEFDLFLFRAFWRSYWHVVQTHGEMPPAPCGKIVCLTGFFL